MGSGIGEADAADSSDVSRAPSVLWYAAPAADWEREALPIGNGALGAMVFGTLASERLQFNEKTLWTGGPGSAQGYDHGDWREPRPGAITAVQDDLDTRTILDPESVAGRLGHPRIGYGAHQTFGDLHLDLPDAPTRPRRTTAANSTSTTRSPPSPTPTKACATKGTSSPHTPTV